MVTTYRRARLQDQSQTKPCGFEQEKAYAAVAGGRASTE
jgi:hypothetical protein